MKQYIASICKVHLITKNKDGKIHVFFVDNPITMSLNTLDELAFYSVQDIDLDQLKKELEECFPVGCHPSNEIWLKTYIIKFVDEVQIEASHEGTVKSRIPKDYDPYGEEK